jgi:regulator of protease activity HflC (stomatin/prohibitin superfamily)
MLQTKTLDEIISSDRASFTTEARAELQTKFDTYGTGVEIISLTLPFLKPASGDRATFEGVSVSRQAEARLISAAQGWADNILTYSVGDGALVDPVIKAVDAYNAARSNWDALRIAKAAEDEIKTALQTMNSKETEAMALLRKGNGAASIRIDNAHVTRWVEMLNARSRASKVRGQITAYEASPEIYRQRTYMAVLARRLPQLRKYIVGIDPSRVNIDLELQTINPLLNFSESIQVDQGANN